MRNFLITALTLSAMASTAMAEPVRLSPAEVDRITAAGFTSTLLPQNGQLEVTLRVELNGQKIVNWSLDRSVPQVSVPEQNLPAAAEGPLPAQHLEQLTITVPAELLRTGQLASAAEVSSLIESARQSGMSSSAPTALPPEVVGQIEASLAQALALQNSAASGQDATFQSTEVTSHAVDGVARAAALNVNVQ